MNRAENVFKVSKPRTDIKPVVDRWTLPRAIDLARAVKKALDTQRS